MRGIIAIIIIGACLAPGAVSAQYEHPPTDFTLTTNGTQALLASWTNNHSSGIDSLSVWQDPDGTPVWHVNADWSTELASITSLTPATKYIFAARVDSGGVSAYSNADTLSTLAAPPAGLAIAERDSTVIRLSFSGGGNPAAAEYAVRDSVRQVWITMAGGTSGTAEWDTESAWEAADITVPDDSPLLIGVVARNPDGVMSAYDWASGSSGNRHIYAVPPVRTTDDWTWYGDDATYYGARGAESVGLLTHDASGLIGQSYSGGIYYVYRLGTQWAIPPMDSLVTADLEMSFYADNSGTDFFLAARAGSWEDWEDGTEYYLFDGHTSGGTSYGGTTLLDSWSTSSYAATDTTGINASGESGVEAAIADTLRWTLFSSRDRTATAPTGDEYVEISNLNLILDYYDYDYLPGDVTVTVIDSDSLAVSWTDRADTETGYIVEDTDGTDYTGTLAADTESARIGGLNPNTRHDLRIKVEGGKLDGSVSVPDSAYTDAVAPQIAPTVLFARPDTLSAVLDTTGTGNPEWTEYAVQDSITGYYVDHTADPDTLLTSGSEVWGTIAVWGDTVKVVVDDYVGKLFSIRWKARSGR